MKAKKREEEKRKRKKRRGRRRSQAKQAKVWNFGFLVWKPTLIMNSMRFGMYLRVGMMIILLKPRVLLGFHSKPIIMESKVDKTLKSTSKV